MVAALTWWKGFQLRATKQVCNAISLRRNDREKKWVGVLYIEPPRNFHCYFFKKNDKTKKCGSPVHTYTHRQTQAEKIHMLKLEKCGNVYQGWGSEIREGM